MKKLKLKKPKIILYLGGGAMSGIFSAGVLTKLLELDAYPRIEAIYAGSSGAINGAYFLTKQQFSSVYYEELTHDFILPPRVFVGLMQLLWNRYIRVLPDEKARNVVNINFAFDIFRNKKPLDIGKLKEQRIPFYAKLLNVATGEIVYMDVRNNGDPLRCLKAAACVKPYYFSTQMIDGKEYIDGTIKEPIGLTYLLERHPHCEIVVIINEPIRREFRHTVKVFLEGVSASLYPYPVHLFSYFMKRERLLKDDIKIAMNNPRVLLVSPPSNNPTVPRTVDPSKLKITYQMGLKEAEKIRNFL